MVQHRTLSPEQPTLKINIIFMYNLNIILQKNAKNEANTIIYREKHRVA